MNLHELAEKIMSKPLEHGLDNRQIVYDLYPIVSEFGLDYYNFNHDAFEKQTRFCCYGIQQWYCTDTIVGVFVYLFDGKIVAVSCQTGRKSAVSIKWVSWQSYKTIEEYLKLFIKDPEEEALNLLDESDYNELFDIVENGYKLGFTGQVLNTKAWLNGEMVTIPKGLGKYPDNGEKYDAIEKRIVIDRNGNKEVVRVDDLIFKALDE